MTAQQRDQLGNRCPLLGMVDRVLHRVRKIALKPVQQAMRDQTVGGLLITDNVLWDGEVVPGFVAKPQRDAAETRAIADYNERVASHPQLLTTIVPLRDGVSIAVKRERVAGC